MSFLEERFHPLEGCYRLKLKRIRDLKQHLRRAHCRSYCVRCGEEFDSAVALGMHQQADEPCLNIPFHVKWLSVAQQKALTGRAKPRLSLEEQWYEIWDLVFPDQPQPDSPYLNKSISEDLSSFLEFCNQHGQQIIQQSEEDMRPGQGDMQQTQRFQTFLADIYDRWATLRGYTQPSIKSSSSWQKRDYIQEIMEPGPIWDTPSVWWVQEPSIPEEQMRQTACTPNYIQPYGVPQPFYESPAETIEPNSLQLGFSNSMCSGMDPFDNLSNHPHDLRLVHSGSGKVSSEQHSPSFQFPRVQDGHHGDLPDFEDTFEHHICDLSASSVREDQHFMPPDQTPFSRLADELGSKEEFNVIQERTTAFMEPYNVDGWGSEFVDALLWDENIGYDDDYQAVDEEQGPVNWG
ncbi:hypothetical protein QBC40DRAFT_256547 [Triangularia verruculosa]|uniref:C2H2-type domain-containing protein n=1 Tax=Triangularia verruculosa TaxID=2587418 RepID=A0AAN7AT03_9PEZI|nr:hypothetical protein QBC40DRAFT_256547 [Triangularia verruculosa]